MLCYMTPFTEFEIDTQIAGEYLRHRAMIVNWDKM